MHAVIVMRSKGYYRFLDSLFEEIVRRGGRVTLLSRGLPALLERVGGPLPEGVTFEEAQPNRHWSAGLLRVTREVRSYLHWLKLRAQPDFLLDRWLIYIPFPVRALLKLARWAWLEPLLTSRPLNRLLAWLEEVAPPGPAITGQLQTLKPDAVLLTPLLYPKAWEIDYLKACRQLGLPHACLIASWDNLTSKGIFHVPPGPVLVWNDVQVEEAARYHGLPASITLPVGAPVFDWLFEEDWQESREEFCREVGLDPARPYILYTASSAINCEDETGIVRNLHCHLGRLAPSVQILVRPHPSGQEVWRGFTPAEVKIGFPPLLGRQVVKRDLFNTLYHAAAVVGLNTSVFLEAAILGRPGVTLLFHDAHHAPMLRKHNQFPHFDYLLRGGFLEVAENEQEGAERLAEIVAGGDRKREARAEFVQHFIRPNGLGCPAGAAVTDLLERLASSRPGATIR